MGEEEQKIWKGKMLGLEYYRFSDLKHPEPSGYWNIAPSMFYKT